MVIAGLSFAVEYLICRVAIGNYYWWVMVQAAIATPSPSVSSLASSDRNKLTLHLLLTSGLRDMLGATARA